MKKKLFAVLSAGLLALSTVSVASADVLITESTSGYYNQSIGISLNGTNPANGSYLFPLGGPSGWPVDPTFDPAPFEPNLSNAYSASALGNWLGDPANLNMNWSFMPIPQTWHIGDETAIIYKINAGSTGFNNVNVRLGVDNGIYVWLDGIYQNGWMAPGGSSPNEYSLNFASLTAGDHFLQILREDHGGSTGYNIHVTGDVAPSSVPEPATMLLFGTGLAGLGLIRKRFKA